MGLGPGLPVYKIGKKKTKPTPNQLVENRVEMCQGKGFPSTTHGPEAGKLKKGGPGEKRRKKRGPHKNSLQGDLETCGSKLCGRGKGDLEKEWHAKI